MTQQFAVEPGTETLESVLPPKSNLERVRIAVFGTFGVGNLGNECTLQATLYNIRRFVPGAEITCICSDRNEAAADYGIKTFSIRYAVPVDRLLGTPPQSRNALVKVLRKLVRLSTAPYRWYKAVDILKDQDALLILGLGMLGDFGISAFDLHYDILGWCLVAKLCRCKVKFVSVGVGPIRDRVSRFLVKTALALGDYRSYRDTFSKEYTESIGLNTKNDHVYPDLAFSLPKPALSAGRNGRLRTVIGVGLIPYYGRRGRSEGGDDRIYRKYVASLAGLICMLVDRGYLVRLIIGDARYDHEIRADLRASLKTRGERYLDERLIDEPAASVSELLSQLAITDLVVASRFHNLLLSIMLGTPVVALSYHEKVTSLMSEFGLSEFCHDIEHFDFDKVISQIIRLERDEEGIGRRALIEMQAKECRKALDEQYQSVFALS